MGVNMGKKTGLNRVVNIKHGITLNSIIKLTVFHYLKKKVDRRTIRVTMSFLEMLILAKNEFQNNL